MDHEVHHGGVFILLTFIAAFILSVIPLGETLSQFRPEWVVMVLIYWCIYLPGRIGVFYGWLTGLFLDVIYGALIGQYALALSIVAFSCYKIQTRFRLFPNSQQSLIIILLVAVAQMVILWVKGINGQAPQTIIYWMPSLTSALFWPLISFFLDHIRNLYGVSE